jgi:hypothetical protein
MSLRDPEFRESLEGFIATSTLERNPLLPPEKVWIVYHSRQSAGVNDDRW